MSKFVATLLFIAVVVSSFWLYPILPEQIPSAFAAFGEPSSYALKSSVIISLALGIGVTYLSMLITSRIMKSKYQRFQKSSDGIFLIVMLVLSAVFTGVMINGLGYEVNMLLFVPLGTGISLIVSGNVIQRFKADDNTGIPLIDTHRDFWNKIRRFVAKSLFISGLFMLPCVLLPVKSLLFAFLTVLCITVAALLFGSYLIYKKHYSNPADKTF